MDMELKRFHSHWQLQSHFHRKWIANWYFEPSWSHMYDITSSCWNHFQVCRDTNAQHLRLSQSNNCNEYGMDQLDQDKLRFHCGQRRWMFRNTHWNRWLYLRLGLHHWANEQLSCWLSSFQIHSSYMYWDGQWHRQPLSWSNR